MTTITGQTLTATPVDLLAVKADGSTRFLQGVVQGTNLSTLLSNGAWTVYPVGEPLPLLTIGGGILDFPWQGFTKPRVSVPSTITVPADVAEFWVPVDVDTTADQSCHVVAEVSNASGATVNTGTETNKLRFVPQRTYYFHRGDETRHWVRFVRPSGVSFSNGLAIKAGVKTYGAANGDQSSVTCTVKFVTGAPAQVITPTRHRKHRLLDLSRASRKNTFDPATIQHHDTGYKNGVPCWRSRLAHGNSQPGNGETGLYMNEDVPAFASVVKDPITSGADGFGPFVNLHTYAFDTPFAYQGANFKEQAVMLNGQRIPEVCGSRGVWSMRAVMPDRKRCWPAFWLIGLYGWPPEIDIVEQFNQVYGTDWPMNGYHTTAGQHYGNWGSNVRKGSANHATRLNLLPGMSAMQTVWAAPHDYACAVDFDASEVTFFFDGIEIGCQRLVARKEDFSEQPYFPMMNVAVASARSPSPTPQEFNADGSGDMKIYDMGYYPTGWTFGEV